MRTAIVALAAALTVLLLTHDIGDQAMCTGAEPAAAGAAKAGADVAAGAGAAGGVAGGTGLTLGTAGATGLTAGAAGAAGFSPALAAAGFTAGEAAGAGLAAGVGSAISKAGAGTASDSGITLSKLAAGASVANAGLGVLSAIKGAKTPPAPTLTAPTVMPSPDDEAARRAKAAILAKMAARSGRTSTILSSDTLGGN